ncbi:MAG: UDP-N-acetylglucosamine 1-carboxyvinyltransferase [Candidatus Saccharibacteria bacterium]|nr:UDP-N-acetylglucosamine 1-carboxyvinyltransferase [Candidatus Saccharibacteria bacterium]
MKTNSMTANEKLGRLIQEIRQHRDLTQTELAQLMDTSQSAINRIEKGKQNLSLEMIKRFGLVLKHPFININDHKVSLRIYGGRKLSGQSTVSPAKNTCLALIFASLLNHGKTILKKVPRIEEIFRIIEVLESLEVNVRWIDNDLEIKRPTKLNFDNLNKDLVSKTRSIIMLIGLAADEKRKFILPFSGGCRLGQRSIIAHAVGLENLGIQIKTTNDHYQITNQLQASRRPIIMYESSDTATINILLAAAKLGERTIIKMASSNYQIEDTCLFLQKLGCKITGLGSTTLTIEGCPTLIKKDVVYHPLEDPIEAMTLVSAALTTNSELTLKRVPLDFLELEMLRISQMGGQIEILKEYVAHNQYSRLGDIQILPHNHQLIAPLDKISCRPYPGLNIDNLPYFVPIVASAKGTSLIHDWVYENRAIYYTELSRMGANIRLADPHRIYVTGPTQWQATDLSCPPAIRPAVINLIGMLAANGISTLRNIYSISRGYENLAQTFNDLGAKIEIMKEI